MKELKELLKQGLQNLTHLANTRLQILFCKLALYMVRVIQRGTRENPSTMYPIYLTNGGNLLREFELGWYFQKPNGEFIREVSSSESEFLSQNCLEISISNPPEHPEFLPTWHFIKSVVVLDDYSNFRAETSCNGGDYSFSTYHDWYVAQYPDGEWKFAFVERYSTSAEFSYDELTGSFQSDLGYLCLSNVADDKGKYYTQAGIEWIDGEKVYGVDEVLEKIGTMSCFEGMWTEVYEYIPSRWDEDDEARIYVGHSFADKKQIITRLKELGCIRNKQMGGNRGRKFRSCNRSRR